MKRYGMVIGLKPEHEAAYRKAHAAVPEAILRTIKECNIRNYSIYLRNSVLYSYFEYTGVDYAADMEKMAADPPTQEWWSRMGPMQAPLEDRAPGEWWAAMEEVFHQD
ncbi:MAG TPA: L-rhamnose mutarotase [Terracidiphilus sp.]|nr:L-rhamnose mutarotase [Terracidiphilus sp.]